MDRLHAMALFVRVVESGSLSEAARRSGCSLATVVRRLAALEAHLGTRLLNRTTRRLQLTEAGTGYLGSAREVLRLVAESEQIAAGGLSQAVGRLVVSAPLLFGRMHVAPLLSELLSDEPSLSAELLLSDRVVDLLEEGVDVAVRIGELPDSSLVALEVASVRRVLCASPDYLQRHGQPDRPADLVRHAFLQLLTGRGQPRWRSDDIRPRLASNSAEALRDAALRGEGVVQLLSYQVADALREGKLVEVLAEFAGPPLPVHVVHAHARLLPAKVRAFRDVLKQGLQRHMHMCKSS